MGNILSGKKICILVASGFDENTFSQIQKTLLKAGAVLKTIAPENGLVHGWLDNAWGHYFPVDIHLAAALGSDFDRLILPGGARAVEKLKNNLHTRRILRHFFEAQKPIVAVGEAAELLTLCDRLAGMEVSASPTALAALRNAGAVVCDVEATIDSHLLTFSSFADDGLETVIQHMAEEGTALHQQAA
jgi:protease I